MMRRIITEQETQKIIADYNNGIGSDSIAKELSLSPTTILRVLKRNNINRRPIKKKTDQDEILKICQEYKDGYSTYDLGEKYGLSFGTINNYLKENNIDRRDMSECHRIYDINEDFFDVIDSEEKSYFLGFFAADGCNQKESNAVRLEVNPIDRDILIKFASLIFKENPEEHIKYSSRTRAIKIRENAQIKTYETNYLVIHSKHMCENLERNGIPPRKTFIIKFPYHINENLWKHYIRGVMDGDGSITVAAGNSNKKIYAFKIVGTQDLCKSISEIIKNKLNITSYIAKCHDADVYYLAIQGSRQVELVLDWLYADSKIWLDRKYNKYLELKTKIQEINLTFKVGGFHYDKYVLKK